MIDLRLGARSSVPLVSVIIPTYNGERFIAATLDAVLAQTHPQVEIIVVDDGSTDSTCQVVSQVVPSVRLLVQRNAGVSAARNAGLAVARGSHVIFLDQDDIWHPTQLARQMAWMAQHPDCGAVVCRYHHWYPVEGIYASPVGVWPPDPGLTVDPHFSGWVYHQFLFDCWALTSGTLMRKEAAASSGGFDVTLAYSEDWDLWLRLSQKVQFALLQWPPVLYRQHPVQGSRALRRHDYRTELLLRYAARDGLSSADGRAMGRKRFAELLSHYQAEFGYHHLQDGHRWTGVRALAAAWWRVPRRLKLLALALAGAAGWRPRPNPDRGPAKV